MNALAQEMFPENLGIVWQHFSEAAPVKSNRRSMAFRDARHEAQKGRTLVMKQFENVLAKCYWKTNFKAAPVNNVPAKASSCRRDFPETPFPDIRAAQTPTAL